MTQLTRGVRKCRLFIIAFSLFVPVEKDAGGIVNALISESACLRKVIPCNTCSFTEFLPFAERCRGICRL